MVHKKKEGSYKILLDVLFQLVLLFILVLSVAIIWYFAEYGQEPKEKKHEQTKQTETIYFRADCVHDDDNNGYIRCG